MNAQGAFDAGLKFVFQAEGGFSNDPNDNGGPTNMGLTQRVYDEWCEEKSHPKGDVHEVTQDEVRQVFRDLYWDEMRLDELVLHYDEKLAVCLFDTGINMGCGFAVKTLQRIVNPEGIDGIMGPTTLGMAAKAKLVGQNVVDSFLIERVNRYNRLAEQNRHMQIYLHGWMNRVKNLRAYLATW